MEEYTVTVEIDPDLPFDDRTGVGCLVRETWHLDGKIHRQFGPAVTIRHPGTHMAVQEEFFREGRRHRYGGPALIVRDHGTGEIITAQYYVEGKLVAPDVAAPFSHFHFTP